jgi:hypothetical protein
MTDVFENMKIFEDEISLYVLGFIDKEQLKRLIANDLYNEFGIELNELPERFDKAIDLLVKILDQGIENAEDFFK